MVALLDDPVPGNIGLVADDDTVVLLHFAESDGIRPADSAGTIEDLANAAGGPQSAPDDSVAWASAVSRHFPTGFGISAADRADESSLRTRDLSIQAILAIDHDTGGGSANTWLVLRGTDVYSAAGAAQYTAYGLKVQIDPAFALAGEVKIAWTWQDLAGATFLDTYVTFTAQQGEIFLLTCTRRWVSTTSVVLRYYIGDELLAEQTVAAGAIGGGTAGTFLVGPNFAGWIDDLKIVDREMSHEEVRAVWRRLSQHQPNGVAMVLGQAPPGAIWAKAAGSDIGNLVKAAGQAVGYATAKIDELRESHLPDRAYRDTIARWEGLVGLQQNGQVALETRRERVLARLQRDNGYSPPKVKDVLSGPFAVAVADIELIEFSATTEDAFATLEAERWRYDPPTAWSIVGNELQLTVASGDLRFQPGAMNPHHCRLPVDVDDDMIVQVKLATYWAALPSSAIVGLFLYNRVTNDALWFGVKNDGGTRKLGYVQLKDGALGAFTALVNPSSDVAYYLRIERISSAGPGSYRLSYSTSNFTSVTSVVVLDTLIQNVTWCGVGAMATTNPSGGVLTATFDDFLARLPEGKRAFHWYALRDPGDPGSPDMNFANKLVQSLKPAHTYAAAITSRSLLCDDTGSGCDIGPMGGL